MENDRESSLFQLNLDSNSLYTLRSAASWAKVLGIVGIIMSVIFFIFAFVFQDALSRSDNSSYYNDEMRNSSKLAGSMALVIYIIIGILYLVSSIIALTFANKTSKALNTNDQQSLNVGLAAARNYFAFWAILLILSLLIMLITLITVATKGVG